MTQYSIDMEIIKLLITQIFCTEHTSFKIALMLNFVMVICLWFPDVSVLKEKTHHIWLKYYRFNLNNVVTEDCFWQRNGVEESTISKLMWWFMGDSNKKTSVLCDGTTKLLERRIVYFAIGLQGQWKYLDFINRFILCCWGHEAVRAGSVGISRWTIL